MSVTVERQGAVTWLWLERPAQLNAIDRELLEGLLRGFDQLETEPPGAVVLAGRGGAFSAGFDVGWMASLDAVAVGCDLGRAVELYERIEGFARPVVASIDGPAVGGGLLLALVADLRLGSERASFGVPEVKIGIFPALGLVPRLERMIGLGAAKRLVLTGEPIDATEARRLGLLDRVMPVALLLEQTQALAEHLASLPPTAVELSKRAFAATGRPGYSGWERDQLAALWDSPERRRAMAGFLERG